MMIKHWELWDNSAEFAESHSWTRPGGQGAMDGLAADAWATVSKGMNKKHRTKF